MIGIPEIPQNQNSDNSPLVIKDYPLQFPDQITFSQEVERSNQEPVAYVKKSYLITASESGMSIEQALNELDEY